MRKLILVLILSAASAPAFADPVEVINCANGSNYQMENPRPRVKATIEAWKKMDTFLGVVVEGNAEELADGFFETGGFDSPNWENVEASEPVRVIYGVGGKRACLVKRGFRTR